MSDSTNNLSIYSTLSDQELKQLTHFYKCLDLFDSNDFDIEGINNLDKEMVIKVLIDNYPSQSSDQDKIDWCINEFTKMNLKVSREDDQGNIINYQQSNHPYLIEIRDQNGDLQALNTNFPDNATNEEVLGVGLASVITNYALIQNDNGIEFNGCSII